MISKITIKNYKSLENVTLNLGPLTVLVGANGSGKSNILDALMFLKSMVTPEQLAHEVLEPRGRYESVVWGGEIKRAIAFRVSWQDQQLNSGACLTYSLDLGYEYRRERGVITKEKIETNGNPPFQRDDSGRVTFTRKDGSSVSEHTFPELSVFGIPSVQDIAEVASLLKLTRNWELYNFEYRGMRPPQPVRKEYRLSETGNNLSTVLHAIYSSKPLIFSEVFESVKVAVPTAEALFSDLTEDGKTYVALKEKDVPQPVGSWGLSDGTLFALALSTALLTPQIPGLLCLESPDASLHPYVMEHVAELLKSASRKTQVIVTTHSPYLLDYLPPESIVVVEKVKGKTVLKPVKGRKGVRYAIEKLGAGDAWYSGHLGGVP
ncbi:MAG: AAA family ATPase [Chloroflexi bacterium]|nr:AAA family ATPase [Chloroflexota bacterium]